MRHFHTDVRNLSFLRKFELFMPFLQTFSLVSFKESKQRGHDIPYSYFSDLRSSSERGHLQP